MATIVEAISTVLSNNPKGLTCHEIYSKILENNLYIFKAKKPEAIVGGLLRRHCRDLEFPTANPRKYFKIVGTKNHKNIFTLYNSENEDANILKHEDSSSNVSTYEKLPEEKISENYAALIAMMKTLLMNAILNASPAFFEELVVELLMKMGYGYDNSSGKVTRYCKDGGIDGIIEEDRLGLDKIYIQAKRNAINNKIGGPIIEQFVGAMAKNGVVKGVFITTSDFATRVKDEYSKPIDGKKFA